MLTRFIPFHFPYVNTCLTRVIFQCRDHLSNFRSFDLNVQFGNFPRIHIYVTEDKQKISFKFDVMGCIIFDSNSFSGKERYYILPLNRNPVWVGAMVLTESKVKVWGHFWVNVTFCITSFCNNLTYVEILWNEAWNDWMERFCPDTPSFCDHIWSCVELFSDLST